MGEKKKSSKIIWFVLLAIVTVVLCYLFTVVYFFFISPYNIALKIGFWPFLNEKDVGKMYLDATTQINFKTMDENFDNVEVSIVGVNVSKDGYILAPLSEFSAWDASVQISVFTKSGTAYKGEMVYMDENYNLAVLKCKNMDGSNKAIKIPYVNIASKDEYIKDTKVIMTSMNTRTRAFTSSYQSGVIEDTDYFASVPKKVEGIATRDFTVSYGFIVSTNLNSSFQGGLVFNKKGRFLGFSFGTLLEFNIPDGQYFVQPAYGAKNFIKNVFAMNGQPYQNLLVETVCGFDISEGVDMTETLGSVQGRDTFYFDGKWNPITAEITEFCHSENKGFYLFKDFVYNDKTVSAGAILTDVKVNGKTTKIEVRNDLIDALYGAKKGSPVEFKYLQAGQTETLSFTV